MREDRAQLIRVQARAGFYTHASDRILTVTRQKSGDYQRAQPFSDRIGAGRFLNHFVFQPADFLNLDSYHVARLQPFGRIHCGRDSARRAGRNDGARQQGERRRRVSISAKQSKIRCLVFECCRCSPLTQVRSSSLCGSGISSGVTIHGPIGP